MGGGGLAVKGGGDSDIDMTPMIDCIMLLLIFFMTTSKMSSQGAVDTPVAKFGEGVNPAKCVMLSVFPGSGGKGATVVLGDGAAGDTRNVAKSENEIRDYLKRGYAGGLGGIRTGVVIKGEAKVLAKDVWKLAKIVGESEGDIKLYLGVKDTPPQ
jgi:biopolymer transport protein ExbD